MLKPHPSAPLEYWFFKMNGKGVALLVDWIADRRTNTGQLRISIHSALGREVLFSPHPTILRHGAAELAMQETSWPRGDIRWHLYLEPSSDRIRPQLFPAEQLQVFDMSLESAPWVTFNGWVEHRGQRFPIVDSSGMVSHYWGRRLPKEWWWISANQFEDPQVSVECTLLRSRVWGSSVFVPLGYVYCRSRSRRRILISPPARIKAVGLPDAFRVTADSVGGPRITLAATGREYASLGQGIINTLVGDLKLSEGDTILSTAQGTAGLERRQSA